MRRCGVGSSGANETLTPNASGGCLSVIGVACASALTPPCSPICALSGGLSSARVALLHDRAAGDAAPKRPGRILSGTSASACGTIPCFSTRKGLSLWTVAVAACSGAFGDPGRTRTPDQPLRRRLLYPAELRGHAMGLNDKSCGGKVGPRPCVIAAAGGGGGPHDLRDKPMQGLSRRSVGTRRPKRGAVTPWCPGLWSGPPGARHPAARWTHPPQVRPAR